MRNHIYFLRLPEMNKKIDELSKAVDALKNR
jgi:hypothetical protein